jgi:Ca2+-binding RTX toxin-like protein
MSGHAQGGDDWLDGGNGHDRLLGDGGGLMSDNARGGSDRLHGGAGEDWLCGDATGMGSNAQGGSDLLVGGSGGDLLYGDAAFMEGNARGGDDRLDAGSGDDRPILDSVGNLIASGGLAGDAEIMLDSAHGGDDRLNGGAGADALYGDAAQAGDEAEATPAVDVRGGADVLVGGTGDDRLWGDFGEVFGTATGGADRFVFAQGSGRDTIGDFAVGRDRIDLTAYRGIDGFAEVRAHTTRSGADTVIDLGAAAGAAAGEDVLTLYGIGLATLDARDFLFA